MFNDYVLTNTQYYQDIADAIRRKKSEIDKKLVSIAVTTPPTKTSYKATEEVSYSGLVVTATFDNNTTANVTSKCRFTVTSGSRITENTTVTVTYTRNNISKTATFNLTAIKLQSLAITTQPTKVDYSSGETMNLSGLVVTATWTNGSTENVTNNCSYLYSSGVVMTTTGSSDISKSYTNTIAYTEGDITKQTSYTGTIKSVLSSIAITTQPTKTSYALGEYFATSGMVVTATYNNTTKAVTGDCTISPANNSRFTSTGTKTITASYTWNGVTKTATTSVSVGAKALSSIAITTQPTKRTYTEGESLSLSGMVVTATYTDDSTGTVTGWTASPANGSSLNSTGTKTITISYTTGGITKTATTTITVNAKTVSSIAITTQPTKRSYTEGETLSLTGMVVTATYSDGSTGTVTGWTASPANGSVLSSTGTKTITISYSNKSTTTTVIVESADTYVNGVKIVPWATGTDAEIAAMVTGAEQGKINLTDYWNVGDERTVSISAIAARAVDTNNTNYLETQPAQDVVLVLMDKNNNNYSYYKTFSSGRTYPYFIVGTKNCLTNGGVITINTPCTTWSETDRCKFWSNDIINAFPSYYKSTIFHEVSIKSGQYGSSNLSYAWYKWFLPAEKEVTGGQNNSMSIEGNALTQWEYYQTANNRKKSNTGSSNYNTWWVRSVYDNTYWCCILPSGNSYRTPYDNSSNYYMGITPCFAI